MGRKEFFLPAHVQRVETASQPVAAGCFLLMEKGLPFLIGGLVPPLLPPGEQQNKPQQVGHGDQQRRHIGEGGGR